MRRFILGLRNMRKHITLSAIAGTLAALVIGLGTPANAESTRPFGDAVTGNVANRLNGTHRVAWMAITLDDDCETTYAGPRHAEIVKISAGHGRRWVGIIHVATTTRAKKARAALECQGVWFVQSAGRFVLPLGSSIYTSGGSGDTYKKSAVWAKKRLGAAWQVR